MIDQLIQIFANSADWVKHTITTVGILGVIQLITITLIVMLAFQNKKIIRSVNVSLGELQNVLELTAKRLQALDNRFNNLSKQIELSEETHVKIGQVLYEFTKLLEQIDFLIEILMLNAINHNNEVKQAKKEILKELRIILQQLRNVIQQIEGIEK